MWSPLREPKAQRSLPVNLLPPPQRKTLLLRHVWRAIPKQKHSWGQQGKSKNIRLKIGGWANQTYLICEISWTGFDTAAKLAFQENYIIFAPEMSMQKAGQLVPVWFMCGSSEAYVETSRKSKLNVSNAVPSERCTCMDADSLSDFDSAVDVYKNQEAKNSFTRKALPVVFRKLRGQFVFAWRK